VPDRDGVILRLCASVPDGTVFVIRLAVNERFVCSRAPRFADEDGDFVVAAVMTEGNLLL
jgi:hypothetical protein